MIVLAIVCLVIVVLIVLALADVGLAQDLTLSTSIGDFVTKPFWLFVLGAATALLTLVGLALLRSGTRHRVAQRREMKRLRKVEESTTGPIRTTGPDLRAEPGQGAEPARTTGPDDTTRVGYTEPGTSAGSIPPPPPGAHEAWRPEDGQRSTGPTA